MIKFRVWDKNTERMWDIETWHIVDEYVDLIEPGKSIADINAERVWRKQSEIILMQFTGLKDVNGNEIYEGDIIITHPKYDGEQSNCGVVQYGCSRRPEFSYKSKNGAYMSIWSSNTYRTYEVIGNVHKNPELLEADK